jgi:hypothetical protein
MVTNKNNGINFFEKISLLIGVILFSAFSYVINKPEIKSVPVTIQKPAVPVLPIVNSNPKPPSVKKQTKKIDHLKKTIIDTIPAKRDAVRNTKYIRVNEPLLKLTSQEQAAKDADAAFREIIQIKGQIELKKGSIGLKKAQLPMKNGKEKDEIQKQIDRERSELEVQRRELERKRVQWQILRRQAQMKSIEEKNTDLKTEIDKEESTTIQKDNDAAPRFTYDEKKWVLKSNPISADFTKELNFKIDKDKTEKWEHKFIMKPLLIGPPSKGTPSAPAKKAEAVSSKDRQ